MAPTFPPRALSTTSDYDELKVFASSASVTSVFPNTDLGFLTTENIIPADGATNPPFAGQFNKVLNTISYMSTFNYQTGMGYWSPSVKYDKNYQLLGPDGNIYYSKFDNNINHDPPSSPSWWDIDSARYVTSGSTLYQLTSQKNQPNGYAGLDSGGKISTNQIPISGTSGNQLSVSGGGLFVPRPNIPAVQVSSNGNNLRGGSTGSRSITLYNDGKPFVFMFYVSQYNSTISSGTGFGTSSGGAVTVSAVAGSGGTAISISGNSSYYGPTTLTGNASYVDNLCGMCFTYYN